MKKFLIILLVIVCLAGVGFLGYTVFRAKNIVSVEIEGQMQTLYLVNETSTPDYEDAKLKVTYKNGTAKYVDLDSKSVKVSDFSTSIEKHGEMKITYKKETLKVPYNVIKSGMYYLQAGTEKVLGSEDKVTFSRKSIKEANVIFSLEANGKIKFYNKSQSGLWIANDGQFDENYGYKISGDTLSVKYGESESSKYEIKANYNEGELEIFSRTSLNDADGDPVSIFTYTFKNYSEYPREATVNSIEVVTGTPSTGYEGSAESGNFVFKKGKTLKNCGFKIYIKVTYNVPLISAKDENNDSFQMLQEVYVEVTDEMVNHNTLNTSSPTNLRKHADLNYGGKEASFYYIVTE